MSGAIRVRIQDLGNTPHIQSPLTPNAKQPEGIWLFCSMCSAGRDRTYDQLVTSCLSLLRGWTISSSGLDARRFPDQLLDQVLPYGIVSTPSLVFLDFGLARDCPPFDFSWVWVSPNSPRFSARIPSGSCVMLSCTSP